MAKILEKVLMSYDALISERLNRTNLYLRKTRKCIGRHLRKGDPKERFCRGRKIQKQCYRSSHFNEFQRRSDRILVGITKVDV